MTADVTWPYLGLQPENVSVDVTSYSISGGRSLTGKQQIIIADPGYWEITLDQIPIRTRADVLLWRSIESAVKGRSKTILVPAYSRKTAPLLASEAAISAILSGNVAANAVQLNIEMISGDAPEAGELFSVSERLYIIKEVLSSSGDIYTCRIWPPARDAMLDNDDVEFDRPVCRCRLKDEYGMKIALDLLKLATPSVQFCEDV